MLSSETMDRGLIASNEDTHWVPSVVKEKRFANWLANARDWNISRNRYWGTPIPLWVSDDYKEVVCITSIEMLRELSGRADITDIHRDSIDDITIPSRQGKGVLRRIPQVFDCWFESGSMPYASKHYPFERKEQFETAFPADFIAEGLDQTRGWFYTLTVLGTAVFGKSPFKNLIVNGLVLAEDGKKMSKRLKNYPDPELVINAHGADALRMYLINSPVVRGEELRFREQGVKDVVRDVVWETFTARVGWAVCGLLRARESDLGAVCAVAKSTRTGEGEARPPPPVRSPVAGTTQIPELSVPAEDQPLFHESGRSTKVAVQRSSTSCFLRAQVLAALGRDGAISILSFPCPEPDAPRIQVPGHGLFPSGLTFVRGDASLITTGEHSPPSAALRCARLHAPAARG